MATHSSNSAWKILWTEEPGGLQSTDCKESDTTQWLTHSHFTPQGSCKHSNMRTTGVGSICLHPHLHPTTYSIKEKVFLLILQSPHLWFCLKWIDVCVCVCVHARSVVQLFATPSTVALQAPLSMGFARQEHWSVLPFPSLGNLPDPGVESMYPASAGRFFTTEPPRKANEYKGKLR